MVLAVSKTSNVNLSCLNRQHVRVLFSYIKLTSLHLIISKWCRSSFKTTVFLNKIYTFK